VDIHQLFPPLRVAKPNIPSAKHRYGRDVDDREAVEILMNLKRTAEVLLKIKRERVKP